MRGSSPQYPVQKGDEILVEISGLNHEGQGVGHYQGLTVFVPFALPEDRVVIQIEEVKSSFARGKVLEFLNSTAYRIESSCACFEECGGCHLQHFDYRRQLAFKEEVVVNALRRIGKFQGLKVLPIIGMKTPFAYRNKAEYPVRVVDGILKSGFFASRSHELIVLNKTCLIQHPLVEKTRKVFMAICNQQDMKKGFLKAVLNRLMIRVGVFSGEVMLVVGSENPVPVIEAVCERLISEMPQVKGIFQSCGQSFTGDRLVMGKPSIREKIGGLEFDISPDSFFQVNSAQAEVLFSKTVEYAGCEGIAVDAYCGTGSISLFLAQEAKKVYGFEVFPDAVKDARHNAEINGIQNVEFIQGDIGVTLKKLNGVKPETIVVDPPRRGCDEKVLQEIAGLQPEKIVYVSCNPATLARDLKILAGTGYSIEEVQPIDMFPQTRHVEAITLLQNEKR